MTKKLLHYTYDTTVREIYDLTKEEASKILEEEKNVANEKNHALILTSKGYENKSFFDAFTPDELSHNYTWIHFCPQNILGFDDDTQEGKYYIMVLESVVKKVGSV